MRVAIDARLLYYQQAGIGAYTLGLIQGFANTSADLIQFTVLISRKDNHSLTAADRFHTVRIFTPCHNRYEQVFLPLELVGHGIDVLHSPDFIPPFIRRCKSVITIHDLAFLFYPGILTKDSWRYYSQVRRAARSADAIVAVSNSTKQDIMHQLGVPEHKVFVVHNGISPKFRHIEDHRVVRDSVRKYGIEWPFILFVGTLEPRKNLGTLIRAFADFEKITPARSSHDGDAPPRLVIVGRRGWLCDELGAQVAALQLSDRVVFPGQVEGDDLVALYNAATFLVQPSIYEGFGLPPLEAMACGTPCIVSNTSSLPEVVGDAAVKVDPLDVQGWAKAMATLWSSVDLREELRQRGLAWSRQFTWETAARKTLEVYHAVARGSDRS